MIPNTHINRNKILTQLVSLFILLALLVTALPQPALAAASVTCAKTYTVVSGDTLSKIAYDNGVDQIALANANDLKSPYVLFIGQKLCIPAGATGSTATSTSSTSTSSSGSSLSASVEANRLVVNIKGFPKKGIFFVKVRSGSPRADVVWYKLGMLRTRKNTTMEAVYRLPKQLREVPTITVCLKNVVTDKTICEKAVQ